MADYQRMIEEIRKIMQAGERSQPARKLGKDLADAAPTVLESPRPDAAGGSPAFSWWVLILGSVVGMLLTLATLVGLWHLTFRQVFEREQAHDRLLRQVEDSRKDDAAQIERLTADLAKAQEAKKTSDQEKEKALAAKEEAAKARMDASKTRHELDNVRAELEMVRSELKKTEAKLASLASLAAKPVPIVDGPKKGKGKQIDHYVSLGDEEDKPSRKCYFSCTVSLGGTVFRLPEEPKGHREELVGVLVHPEEGKVQIRVSRAADNSLADSILEVAAMLEKPPKGSVSGLFRVNSLVVYTMVNDIRVEFIRVGDPAPGQ